MLAPSFTRKRVFYVNLAASAAEPTGSIDAPFNSISAALAQCLPYDAYPEDDTALELLPTLILLAGCYPPCTLDRPVQLQGAGRYTILTEVTCATEFLIIWDCTISALAGTPGYLELQRCRCSGACAGSLKAILCDLEGLEWDGKVKAESCSALPLTISGNLIATNSTFDRCTVSGDATLTRCNGAELVAGGDLYLSGCQVEGLDHMGGLLLDSTVYEAIPAEGADTLTVIGSTLLYGRTADMFWLCSSPRAVAVPEIVALTEEQAIQALAVAGITLFDRREVYDPVIEAGIIVEQRTPAGTFGDETLEITYFVSLGPEPVQVPDLTGSTLEAAGLALSAVGLVSGTSNTEYSETVAIDLIISQSPLAGEMVAPGSAVDVVVSLGPEE